jgi:hypothetical protein
MIDVALAEINLIPYFLILKNSVCVLETGPGSQSAPYVSGHNAIFKDPVAFHLIHINVTV